MKKKKIKRSCATCTHQKKCKIYNKRKSGQKIIYCPIWEARIEKKV